MKVFTKYTLTLFSLIIICTLSARAQNAYRYDSWVQLPSGQAVVGAVITVCPQQLNPATPCTPLATIYSDIGLTQQINQTANPIISDAGGNYGWYMSCPGPNPNITYTITGIGFNPISRTVTCPAGSGGTFTPSVMVNSVNVLNPNFQNSSTVTYSVTPPNIQATASGGGGSGCTVAGNPGDVQINNGSGGCAAGSLNDNGAGVVTDSGALVVKATLTACGPDPWYDITCFGARNVNITTTGTSTDTSHITVGVTTFKTGDPIIAVAGGANVSVSGPTLSSVSSGETESETQSVAPMVTGLVGSSVYSYRAFGVTPNRGVTAAGPIITTSTGPATLGAQSITVTGSTLVGSTESFTTSAAHGLLSNAAVHFTAGSNSNPLSGWFPVQVDSTTAFHTPNVLAQWSSAGVSTASGHFVYFIGNQLLFTFQAGIEYYGICAQRPADGSAWHIIGYSFPAIPGFSTTAGVFDDFGAGISANPPNPWFLSDANCTNSSATPEMYTGFINGGGGTTSIAISPPLTNAITAQTVKYDIEPAVLSAAQLAAGQTYVYIPFETGRYQMYFPLTMPPGTNVVQAGDIDNYDYIHQQPFGTGGSGSVWYGGYNMGAVGCPAFAMVCGPNIVSHGPIGFWNDGSSIQNVTLFYQPNAIGLFSDINCHGNACLYYGLNSVVTGTSANDKWGMPVVSRGGEWVWQWGLISSGENQVIDESWTPACLFVDYNNGVQQAVGEITFSHMHGNRRGCAWVQSGGTAIQFHVDHFRRQGGINPLFWIQNLTGNVGTTIDIRHPFGDTESQAKLAMIGTNGASFTGDVELTMDNGTSTDGGGNPPNITGAVGAGAGVFPTFDTGAIDSGGNNRAGWNLANGNLNATNPINVPGSTNTGSSTVSGNQTVNGTSQVGLLNAGNSQQLISSGTAMPLASLWNVAHSSTASVTTPTSFIGAGQALAVGIFVGNTSATISSISDTLTTSFTVEGSQSLAGAGGGVMFWYFGCVPSGGTDAISVTSSNSPVDLAVWDVLGVNCSTPVDGTPKFSLATTATPSVATITTTNANELVLAWVRTATGITATPGSGYTLDHSGTVVSGSIQMQHQEFPLASSTTTAPMTLSASAAAAEGAIALVGQIPQLGSPLDPWSAVYVAGTTACVPLLANAQGLIGQGNLVMFDATCFAGADASIKVNACLAAALAAAGICDARGLIGNQNLSQEIDVGNSTPTPVTLILPSFATWTSTTAFTGGTACLIKQFGLTTITGSAPELRMQIKNGSGTGGINYLYCTGGSAGTSYIQADHFTIYNPTVPTASNIAMLVNVGVDGSKWTNIQVVDYMDTVAGVEVINGSCCSASFDTFTSNSNYTGPVPFVIVGNNSGTPNGINLHNVSLDHPSPGQPNMTCTDTSSAHNTTVTFSGTLYEEGPNSGSFVGMNQFSGCGSVTVGSAVLKSEIASSTATGFTNTNTTNTAITIAGLSMVGGGGTFTYPATAIVNSFTGKTVHTDPKGNLSGYRASVAFEELLQMAQYTVATLPSASTVGNGTVVQVTDATSFTGGTCTGGGSDLVFAISNGTSWVCQ